MEPVTLRFVMQEYHRLREKKKRVPSRFRGTVPVGEECSSPAVNPPARTQGKPRSWMEWNSNVDNPLRLVQVLCTADIQWDVPVFGAFRILSVENFPGAGNRNPAN